MKHHHSFSVKTEMRLCVCLCVCTHTTHHSLHSLYKRSLVFRDVTDTRARIGCECDWTVAVDLTPPLLILVPQLWLLLLRQIWDPYGNHTRDSRQWKSTVSFNNHTHRRTHWPLRKTLLKSKPWLAKKSMLELWDNTTHTTHHIIIITTQQH